VIGGHDHVLIGAGPPDEPNVILTGLLRVWPDLVVQDADSDAAVAPKDAAIGRMTEFFIYRSRDDFHSWAAEGATDANQDTMIHVLLGLRSTTIVSDRKGSVTYDLAERLVTDLVKHRTLSELTMRRARARVKLPPSALGDLGLQDRLVAKGDTRAPREQVNH
jgi:hypothetical protein